MRAHNCACFAGLLALCRAQTTTAAAEVPSIISDCHLHESTQFCMVGTTEYEVHLPTTATATAVPAEYTGCHSHDDEMFCMDANGDDIEIHLTDEGEDDHADEDSSTDADEEEGENCHYHAGVKHCTGGSSSSSEVSCAREESDYNISLRIGLLFVILVTSALGVFGPILVHKILPQRAHVVFTVLKQFGTGVIISTAFVHLYTHANLMFGNECLADHIDYEATAAAILMAGLFLSFIVEYLGQRLVRRQAHQEAAAVASGRDSERFREMLHQRTETINIMVLEAGVIFHSLLIGLTLVVAGDSFFKTLFVVILFHQMFEGIALGSRIAALGSPAPAYPHNHHGHPHTHGHGDNEDHHHVDTPAPGPGSATGSSSGEPDAATPGKPEASSSSSDVTSHSHAHPITLRKKLLLAAAFALVTPLGMAIGIGVLNQFNGNDPATLIAIGTLDALSAGILVWVGVVEMWAEDWMMGGELVDAGFWTTVCSLAGLMGGMAIMSLLGKWA